jgi:hypothetical protein
MVLWRQYMPFLSSVMIKSGLQSIPLIIDFSINCFYKKNHHFYKSALTRMETVSRYELGRQAAAFEK